MTELRRYRDTDLYCSKSGKIYKNDKEVGRKDRNGYYLISMGSRGSGIKKRNRIIAECWLTYPNQLPDDMDVHHKNGKKDDDRASNLEILTKEEHYRKHNKLKPVLKMSTNGVPIKIYETVKEAEEDNNLCVNHSHITDVIKHNNPRYASCAGYDWYYYMERYELVKMIRLANICLYEENLLTL